MNNKKFLIYIFKILLVMVGALAILVVTVNVLSQDKVLTTRFIKFQITRLLDLDSEVINPHAYIDWDLQYKIRADKLTFIEKDTDLVAVDDLHLDVFIPYLLLRKIYITNMNGQNLYVNFERYKTNKINILEIFNITGFFKVYFHNSSISVNKYFFNFTDNYHAPSEKMVVTGDNILLSKFTLKKYIQLVMDGNIDYNNKITPFSVNYNSKFPNAKKDYNLGVNLPDFDFETFKTYLNEFAPNTTIKGKGSIQTTVNESKYFNIFGKMKDIDFHSKKTKYAFKYKNEIMLSSRFAYENKNIIIDEFNVSGKDFAASTYGKINNIKSLPLDIDLHIKVNKNSNLNSIFKILPSNISALNHAIDKVKKYNVGGKGDGEVYAKGKIGHLNIDGYINVHEADFGYDKKLPKSKAFLNFKKDTLSLNCTIYPNYTKAETVNVSGDIKITKPIALDLNVNSSKNVDLHKAQKTTIIASDIFNFKTGPVKVMDIQSGKGTINLNIKGTPPNINLNGQMLFSNGVVSYPGLSGNLFNVSGQIDFDGKEINYKNIKGVQAGVWAYAHGNTEIHGKGLTHFYLDIPKAPIVFAQNFINNSEMLEKVSSGIRNIENPQGNGSLNMHMLFDKNGNTSVDGEVKINNNSSCNIKGLYYRINNIAGNVNFNNEKSTLDFYGIINDVNTQLSGEITQKYSDIEITTPAADIKKAYDIIFNSPMFSKNKDIANDFSDFSGTIKTKTRIAGNLVSDNTNFYTEIDILQGKLKYLDIPEYFYVNHGQAYIHPDKVLIENVAGNFYETPFKLNGTVLNQGKKNETRNVLFEIYNFDLKDVKNLTTSGILNKRAKELLKDFELKSGFIDIISHITTKNNEANIKFHDATAFYKPTEKNINLKSGEFLCSDDILKAKKIFVQIDESDLLVDGFIKNHLDNPYYNLHISSNMSDNDFNETLVPLLHLPVKITGKIYTNINFTGTLKKWDLQARAMLDEFSYVLYKGANLGKDLSKFMFFDLSGENDSITINTCDVYSDSLTPHAKKSDIMAKINGKISAISSDYPVFENIKADIYEYMNLSFLNILFYNPAEPKTIIDKGIFKGNLILNGATNNLNVNGKAEAKEVFIPLINTTIHNMDLDFKNNLVNINDADINIAGSNIKVNATLNNIYTAPVTIDTMYLTSDLVNFDEIIKTFTPLVSSLNTNEKTVSNKNFPIVVIKNGNFDIKQLTYKQLTAKNSTGEFTVDENHFCSLKNLKSESDNGELFGDIDYNLLTGSLEGNLELKNVMANNFASTFLNLPNEIYGSVDSNIKFSSHGTTNEDLIKNLNGVSYFKINNGRMIRLGSVEYMLRVANTFKGGIKNLNLNAIVNIVAPRTGYFDTIEGDIQIQDGVVIADKITSKSSELNLFLTGSYNMNESTVNATVIGQMPTESKDSILWLGPIGKISLNSLVRKLTREVSKEENKFLYNPLSYINEIPGLKNNKGDFRFFVVSLKGDLYNDKYVQDFKWIK